MTDLNDLRRAGHSTTSRAWLTNPVRRGVLKLAGPHLLRILDAVGELNGRVLGLERRADAIERQAREGEQRGQDLAARQQSGGTLRDELLQLARAVDGMRKDQLAVGHRLGSLEDQAEQRQQAGAALQAELLALAGAAESLRQDQAAAAQRLGGIEQEATQRRHAGDALQAELRLLAPAIETLRQEQLSLHRRVDGVAAEAETAHAVAEASAAQALAAQASAVQASAAQASAAQASAAQPVGIATLPHNLPMAVRGTSLVLHDGPYGRFLLRQPDLISDHILAGGFWDAHLKPVIERAAASDRTAIDAGAYLGFHSVYMARFFRIVHAFEPQVEIYRMLSANLLLNACHNVIAANAALYDGAGHMRLADRAEQEIPVPGHDGGVDYDHVGNAAALTFQPVEAGARPDVLADGAADAPARTVDQLGLADLGFMKVDTQGSDLHVLRGARATIQRCRPVIAAEYERELARIHGDTLDDYHRFFDEAGYAVEVLDDRGDGKQIDLLAMPR